MYMFEKTLEKAAIKFNGKYDYSKASGTRTIDKALIICPTHGEFTQEARVHLRSNYGCPECAKIGRSRVQSKSQDVFIEEAKKAHNNKYTYEHTKYVNDSTKVTITCPIHGDFQQQAGSHIGKAKCGCKQCGRESSSKQQQLPVGIFMAQCQLPSHIAIDETTFQGTHKKVLCHCAHHGEFRTLPETLQKGSGICPSCANQLRGWRRSLYIDRPTTFYAFKIKGYDLYKIGITKANDIAVRYGKQDKNLVEDVIFQLTFLSGEEAWDLEKLILKLLGSYIYQGPAIFNGTGTTEILSINPIEVIQKEINAILL